MHLVKGTDSIVALVDILGFSYAVKCMKADPEMTRRVEAAVGILDLHAEQTKSEFHSKYLDPEKNIQATMFSDTIIISSANPNDYLAILCRTHQVAAQLMAAGFLSRGGISRGHHVHEGHIFYGEAVVDAHYMESKLANYPRILVNTEIANEAVTNQHCARLLRQDVDGLWYVNLFMGPTILATTPFPPDVLPKINASFWESAYRCIEDGLRTQTKPDVAMKFAWAANKYNEAVPAPHLTISISRPPCANPPANNGKTLDFCSDWAER